jgi:hypothetical protein
VIFLPALAVRTPRGIAILAMAILFLATIMGSLGAAEDVLEPGVPEVPENPDGTGTTFIPVETPPPQPEPYNPLAMFNPLLLLVIILVIGALAAYVPGEVQRMRIETAFRESMDARLALAKGDFTVALAGFDRAIDQAHARRVLHRPLERSGQRPFRPGSHQVRQRDHQARRRAGGRCEQRKELRFPSRNL